MLETGANQIQGVTFFVEIQRHSKSPHVLCKHNFPRNPVIYYCADQLCDEVQLHIEPFNGETWTLFIRTYFKNNLPCWILAENLLQIRGNC